MCMFNYNEIFHLPKTIITQSNQVFESPSPELRTIKAHLANDNPNPANAPVLPATVWQKQSKRMNPTQLNINATEIKKVY